MTINRDVFITMIGLLVMIFSFVGCNNQQTERNENVMTDSTVDSQKNIRSKLIKSWGEVSKVDFFSLCSEMESWIGAIQGAVNKDKRLLGFKSCNTDSLSFDILMQLKNSSGDNELSMKFEEAESNGYKEFNVFAFLIPMENKEKFESGNPHGDPNIYPSVVTVYILDGSKWYLISKKTVNDLNEYGQLQYDILNYSIPEDEKVKVK